MYMCLLNVDPWPMLSYAIQCLVKCWKWWLRLWKCQVTSDIKYELLRYVQETVGIQVKEVPCEVSLCQNYKKNEASYGCCSFLAWPYRLLAMSTGWCHHVLPLSPPSLMSLSKALTLSNFFARSNLGLGMGISRSGVFKIGLLHSLEARIWARETTHGT